MEKVNKLLCSQFPSLHGIYLYGSGATNFFSDESDVDLALLCKEACSGEAIWNARFLLEEMLSRKVDLVDLRLANQVLQMQIIYHGIKILDANEREIDFFEHKATVLYLTFVEDRRIIMDGIREDLSVYG